MSLNKVFLFAVMVSFYCGASVVNKVQREASPIKSLFRKPIVSQIMQRQALMRLLSKKRSSPVTRSKSIKHLASPEPECVCICIQKPPKSKSPFYISWTEKIFKKMENMKFRK